MSKTKILGWLGLVGSAISVAIDLLDGGGFNYQAHLGALYTTFGSLGLIFLRNAVQKVLDAIGSTK